MSLTGCHIWRQIMPTGGVNSSHSGKVLSRPGLCNLLFSFSSQSVPSILFIFLSVNYWYRLMSSCLPMVYKSLLNSIILVLELSWLGQWEPLQAGSCVHMVFSPSFFFFENPFYFGHNEVFQDHFVYTVSQPWNQPFLWGAQIPFRGESVQHLKIHVFSDPLGCLSVGPMLLQLPVAWLMNFGSSWNDGV